MSFLNRHFRKTPGPAVIRAGPKLSLIVPAYNVAEYLPKCLDSLLNQTLADLEIIVVDDGGGDESGKMADEYAARDPRVMVIHQANAGVAVARNVGMAAAKGEYIGFADPDDFVDAEFFEMLANAASGGAADIAKGGHRRIDGGKRVSIPPPADRDPNAREKIIFDFDFKCAVYRNDFLRARNLDFPAGICHSEDMVFCAKAVFLANKIVLARPGDWTAPMYNYCRRAGSLDSEKLNEEKIRGICQSSHLLTDFINGLDLPPGAYNLVFSCLVMGYFFSVAFPRADGPQLWDYMAAEGLRLYDKCKYKAEFAELNEPSFTKMLADRDTKAMSEKFRIRRPAKQLVL